MINLRRIIAVVLVSFILHLIWETAHIGLYTGYDHITRFPITLYATVGDVGYVVLGVLVLILFKSSSEWLDGPSRADSISLAFLGFCIALFVEYKGLMLGRWSYTLAMPIVPLLNVGLSPLLQMMLLLPISVWLSGRLRSKMTL